MTPEAAAAWLAGDPGGTGLFLDFDGTLTPIVGDPTTSRLDPQGRDLLARLASRLSVVSVISGRPAAFLLDRAAAPGVLLLGLYGLESAVDGAVTPRPEIVKWEPAVQRAKQRLDTELGGRDGVWVEDKGRTVAVHWRHAPDHAAAELLIGVAVSGIAEATGLAVEPGKFVAELRPPSEWDKGAAVTAVAEDRDLSRVGYVGDDLGDLPALEAVKARAGIAIGVDHGEETPPQLRAAADVLLDGPEAVRRWLEQLSETLA